MRQSAIMLATPWLCFGVIVFSLATPSSLEAGVLNVPLDYSRITDALAAAAVGDSVIVAPGVYSASTNGEALPLFLANDGVNLIGSGYETCTIDAGDAAGVIQVLGITGGRISGFTLTGGNAFGGGGVRIDGGSVEIDHNLIASNRAREFGSGIYLTAGADPWIHHNVVWENLDVDVAGGGDPHGIQTNGASGLIEHNLVGRGDSNGLLIAAGDEPTVRNNIFYENGILGLRGRGICHFGGPGTVLAHNLFFGNAIAAVLVNNGGFQDITGAVANDLDGGDGIYGNLDGDPLFVNAESEDWNLTLLSPAMDNGDPQSPQDPDGSVADIGPFFFDQTQTGVRPVEPNPVHMTNFPNPFRSSTTVRFELARGAEVRFDVFDSHGSRVAVVERNYFPAGTHRVIWNGRDDRGTRVGAGVYFLTLEISGGRQTQRITVLP